MIAVMAKKQSSKKPRRRGLPISVWVSVPVFEALERYLNSTYPKVSKKAVAEAAFTEFLTKVGFPPVEE